MDKYFSSPRVKFLLTEIETGLTFAHVAVTAKPNQKDKIERNRKNARKAYDTLLRFQPQVSFSEEENAKFKAGKKKLEAALRVLGEPV